MQLFNHFPMARVMSDVKDVRWAGANTSNSVLELIRERGLESKKIALVGAIPYQHYNKLSEKFPNATFTDLGGKIRMMRTVRSAEEIERIGLASKLTEQSNQATAEALKQAMRDEEIPDII